MKTKQIFKVMTKGKQKNENINEKIKSNLFFEEFTIKKIDEFYS